VIVSEEDSQGGTTRTTTAYRDRVASVQEVYTRVSYDGVNFERTYRPDPPVITLVYPLTVGRDWHGSWKGDVSGDYEAAVASNESVTVGGRHIATRKVFSVTNFRGEFQGRADLTAWIDPQTLAVVRAKGVVHLKSSYGGYNTKFEMILSSGPSY
jgi:hypothetical protein